MILVIHSNQAINEGNNPAVDRFLKNINEEKWRVLKKTSPRIAHKWKKAGTPAFSMRIANYLEAAGAEAAGAEDAACAGLAHGARLRCGGAAFLIVGGLPAAAGVRT